MRPKTQKRPESDRWVKLILERLSELITWFYDRKLKQPLNTGRLAPDPFDMYFRDDLPSDGACRSHFSTMDSDKDGKSTVLMCLWTQKSNLDKSLPSALILKDAFDFWRDCIIPQCSHSSCLVLIRVLWELEPTVSQLTWGEQQGAAWTGH